MTKLARDLRKDFRKILKKITKVRNWKLLVILIPLLFLTATLLRLDHLKMTELKEAVLAADTAEDDEKIETTLTELKDFVRANIVINIVETNGVQEITFGTGPFYLEQLYIRTASAVLAEAQANAMTDDNPNGNVFAKAMEVCQPIAQANGWLWNSAENISCYQNELNSYPTTDALVESYTVELPSTALFRYDYASPVWAPTWSGWLIVFDFVLIIIILIRVILWLILRIALIILG